MFACVTDSCEQTRSQRWREGAARSRLLLQLELDFQTLKQKNKGQFTNLDDSDSSSAFRTKNYLSGKIIVFLGQFHIYY
jgi:hypothetical protein